MARTRRSSPTLLTPLAALMLVNLACSDDTSPSQPGDAGVITDAGTIPDAATSPDAGTSPDAATSPDASPEPVIELVAGDLGSFGNLDGHRSVALFGGPSGIARGPDGALFVADSSNYVIRRIAPDGTVSTFAGVMGEPGTDDGPGARAKFLLPVAIVAANDGTLFVSDTDGPTIRKIAPDGTVETWVGKAGEASGRDGDRTTARLRGPEGLALAANGDLFVADRNGQTIRRITPDGTVETHAGADQQPGSTDGDRLDARFADPWGIAVAPDGTLAISDAANRTIRLISPEGVVSTLAGTPGAPQGTDDGTGAEARFGAPRALAFRADGAIIVADTFNDLLRLVTRDGVVTRLAGSTAGAVDGPLLDAKLSFPTGLLVEVEDGEEVVYVTETGSSIVRRVADDRVERFAGMPTLLDFVDGPRLDARFFFVRGMLPLDDGRVLVADQFNSVLRTLDATHVATWVGVPQEEGTNDGSATEARLAQPSSIVSDGADGYYVADSSSGLIRHVDADGDVTTFAGGPPIRGQSLVDGPRLDARFSGPAALARDAAGNLWVADAQNHAIRKIDVDGNVTTVAGDGLPDYLEGVGGDARFAMPMDLLLVGDTIYVADTGNSVIRRIRLGVAGATVDTLAGGEAIDGIPAFGDADGTGRAARFRAPRALLLDGDGFLVADTNNSLIRRVTFDGVVTTLAGTRGLTGVRTGPLPSSLFEPHSLARTPDGRVLVGNQTNIVSIGPASSARVGD